MRYLLVLLLFPLLAFAQEYEFQQECAAIPVEIDGWSPFSPWSGGWMESAPEFCDIDADEDPDCFVGNFNGKITYFLNSGSITDPYFVYITRNFAEVFLGGPASPYAGRTSPEFCDLDADGDYDLFTGDFRGLIHYWENIGTPESPEYFLVTDSLGYIDVPGYSKFDFKDMDFDGDYDLLIGNYYGTLW